MLTIILGVVVTILFIWVVCIICNNISPTIVASLGTSTIIAGILVGLFIPVSGYTEWKLENEIELISLSNTTAFGGEGLIYVSLSADNSYTYRYEIESEFGTETSKEYTTNTLVKKSIEEIEDSECETPMLKVYSRKGKKSIWTFALFSKEEHYVFYVPEGTISKEVKLS